MPVISEVDMQQNEPIHTVSLLSQWSIISHFSIVVLKISLQFKQNTANLDLNLPWHSQINSEKSFSILFCMDS